MADNELLSPATINFPLPKNRDSYVWSLLGIGLTGGLVAMKIFGPNIIRQLREENHDLTNKIAIIQNEVNSLRKTLNDNETQIKNITYENQILANEISTSGKGDLFHLFTEIKYQLQELEDENNYLKNEVTYMRPLLKEAEIERKRAFKLERDLLEKVRENSKISRELETVRRKLKSVSSENEFYVRSERMSSASRQFKFDWYDPEIGGKKVIPDDFSDRDDLSSVSTFKSSDNNQNNNSKPQKNSKIPEKTPPKANTTSIKNTTNNIFNNFFNMSSSSTTPKNNRRMIESISEEPLNVTIEHSIDPKTIDKIDHFQVKIKNDFGLSVNLNLIKKSSENDNFEVYFDKILVFSRVQAGNFPKIDVVIQAVKKVLAVDAEDREEKIREVSVCDE